MIRQLKEQIRHYKRQIDQLSRWAWKYAENSTDDEKETCAFYLKQYKQGILKCEQMIKDISGR